MFLVRVSHREILERFEAPLGGGLVAAGYSPQRQQKLTQVLVLSYRLQLMLVGSSLFWKIKKKKKAIYNNLDSTGLVKN